MVFELYISCLHLLQSRCIISFRPCSFPVTVRPLTLRRKRHRLRGSDDPDHTGGQYSWQCQWPGIIVFLLEEIVDIVVVICGNTMTYIYIYLYADFEDTITFRARNIVPQMSDSLENLETAFVFQDEGLRSS